MRDLFQIDANVVWLIRFSAFAIFHKILSLLFSIHVLLKQHFAIISRPSASPFSLIHPSFLYLQHLFILWNIILSACANLTFRKTIFKRFKYSLQKCMFYKKCIRLILHFNTWFISSLSWAKLNFILRFSSRIFQFRNCDLFFFTTFFLKNTNP